FSIVSSCLLMFDDFMRSIFCDSRELQRANINAADYYDQSVKLHIQNHNCALKM
ncbi:26445_t:CDS:1, partial [Dentiscutata erythropus]